MKKTIYLLMFVLVACGAFTGLAAEFITLSFRNVFFSIIALFTHPLVNNIFGISIHLPQFVFIFSKWFVLLLVFHRLLVFLKAKNVVIPSSFNNIFSTLTAIGLVSLLFAEIMLLLSATATYPSFNYLLPIAPTTFPLIFTIVELLALRSYAKNPNPSIKRDA